jgi:hypothetical protein
MYYKYVKRTVFIILALLSIITALSIFALKNNMLGFGFMKLLNYQKEKLENIHTVDIAILGDSSGGNAINSSRFADALNLKTVSLSLTGNFGYIGDLEIVERLVEKGVKTIMIFHTPFMLTGESVDRKKLKLFINPGYISILSNLKILLSTDIVLNSIKQTINPTQKYTENEIKKYDYIPQKRDKVSKDFLKSLNIVMYERDINFNHINVLSSISKLCNDNAINCIYVYAPIHESFCKNKDNYPYLIKSNDLIAGSGMDLLDDLYCIPDEEIGDSIDHIAYKYKNKSTDFYIQKYKNYLKTKSKQSQKTK